MRTSCCSDWATPATTASIRRTPTSSTSVNKIGNYTTPRTQEVMFGVDHELMPNFGISATYTYRYYDHFDWRSGSLIGVNSSNYTQTGHADRQRRSGRLVQRAVLRAQRRQRAARRRQELRRAEGLSPALHGLRGERRQADVEQVDGPVRLLHQQPPRVLRRRPTRSTIRRRTNADPRIDGGLVVTQTGGSGKSNIYHRAAAVPVHRERDVPGCRGASTSAPTDLAGRAMPSRTSAARWRPAIRWAAARAC